MSRRKAAKKSERRVVTVYPYRDATGKLVYQLVRYDPKDFEFQRPDGRPLPATRRRHLLYRLPELLAAESSRTVFVVEGEKDVDRLWSVGLVATCNEGGGGKGKWSAAHSKPLRGRAVGIIPDYDKTGEEHAQDVARHVQRFASVVKMVCLAYLPQKGDVSDWLDARGTPSRLESLFAEAKPWSSKIPYAVIRNRDALETQSIARELIIGSNLSAQEKLLLIILSESRDKSQDALAAYLGVTKRRLRQIIRKLNNRSIVSTIRDGRKNYHFFTSLNLQMLASGRLHRS